MQVQTSKTCNRFIGKIKKISYWLLRSHGATSNSDTQEVFSAARKYTRNAIFYHRIGRSLPSKPRSVLHSPAFKLYIIQARQRHLINDKLTTIQRQLWSVLFSSQNITFAEHLISYKIEILFEYNCFSRNNVEELRALGKAFLQLWYKVAALHMFLFSKQGTWGESLVTANTIYHHF
jgi:hypothetical protein